MLAAIPALARNQARALLLRRTIPHDIVYRAATIMTIATLVAVIVSFALLASHDMAFEKAAFETVSALATSGLSIGGTAELNALGKWLIIVTMFIGRVGPISLALATRYSAKRPRDLPGDQADGRLTMCLTADPGSPQGTGIAGTPSRDSQKSGQPRRGARSLSRRPADWRMKLRRRTCSGSYRR
ncbi:potassium transporter TrkG [Nannocystis sp. bb15-2]|uniref:Potassium transporter TrkG n=1 Tax=Nannocystis bainbridge TaxID=2995303 RepID=A0ABT5EBD2_9BACT|nr:potassium transporter TrkG [Nannocystis bainbridge]MDC0723188.1 potassium transporter TrkG [Nannocystis bainbridge]